MVRNIRKLLSILMILVMTAAVFVGCGNTEKGNNSGSNQKSTGEVEENNEPVTISFWHGWTGAEEETLGEIIDKFQAENPNITVETLPTPFDKLNEKLRASLPTDQAPDLFLGPHDWAGTFAALGQVEEVTPYISDVKDNYLASALEAGKYQGKFYGIPDSVKTYVLIYNKDLVKNPPKTVAEMREIAKANTKDGQYGLIFDMGNFYFAHAYFAGYGGQIFKDDKAAVGFENEGIIDSLKLFNEIKNEDKVTIKDFDYNVMMDLMQSGKTAMIINGPWCFGDFDNAVAEGKGLKNWGAVKVPAVEEGKAAKPFMGVDMLYIPKNAKNKEASAKFAKYMTSAEIQKLMNEKAGHVPSNTTVDLGDNWQSKIILEQAADAVAMPNIPEMGPVWKPAGEMYGKVLDGSSTPEDALKEAHDLIVNDIKEMHGE